MKVLMTIWNGRVSPVFDVAGKALIIETEGNKVISEKTVNFPSDTFLSKIQYMLDEKISVLICGAISRQAELSVSSGGTDVYSFISGETEAVLEAFLENRLFEKRFHMPGCGRKHRCRRHGSFNKNK